MINKPSRATVSLIEKSGILLQSCLVLTAGEGLHSCVDDLDPLQVVLHCKSRKNKKIKKM
jgi:hypothetical protein